jgi:hypothetical protein
MHSQKNVYTHFNEIRSGICCFQMLTLSICMNSTLHVTLDYGRQIYKGKPVLRGHIWDKEKVIS